jgi:hypothetical protein
VCIEYADQRLSRKLLRWNLRAKRGGIDINGVAAWRLNDLDAGLNRMR